MLLLMLGTVWLPFVYVSIFAKFWTCCKEFHPDHSTSNPLWFHVQVQFRVLRSDVAWVLHGFLHVDWEHGSATRPEPLNRRGYSMDRADLPFTSLSTFPRIFMQCCTFLRLDPMFVLMYIYTIHTYYISMRTYTYIYICLYIYEISHIFDIVRWCFSFNVLPFQDGLAEDYVELQDHCSRWLRSCSRRFDLVSFQEFSGFFFFWI